MTSAGSNGAVQTFRILWRRAPLWRLFLLLAVLLTLLFGLFPPHPAQPARTTPPADSGSATYQSRIEPSVAAPPPPASQAAPPASAEVLAAKPKLKAAAVAPRAPSATPQTAKLTMVTAGPPKAPDESGLDAALLGPVYHDAVTVDGFTIPLPPGAWVNLAHSTINEQSATGDAHFLGRIRDKRLIGAIRLFAARSKEQPGAGFNAVKACAKNNPDIAFVAIDDEMVPHGHQACWNISNVYAAALSQWADRAIKIPGLDRAAAGDMAAKGVTYPQDFIKVQFTRTESWGLLEVGYLFSPETEGISSNPALAFSESDWAPANIARYPEKVAYVEKLKAWGSAFWPRFKAAFEAATP